MPEVRVRDAGGDDQEVERQRTAVGELQALLAGIDARDFGKADADVALTAEDPPNRRCDVSGGERGGRDLIQQRLKHVMVAPVDYGYRDIIAARERPRGLEPREAAADDHNFHRARHSDLKISDMTFPARTLSNPLRSGAAAFSPAELEAVAAFAADRPVTPLHDAPALAAGLGLSGLLIKDESSRWGLNAFKITGVGYALDVMGGRPSRLVCASAGNHGRAVARVARERGVPCRVHLPDDALAWRVAAIRGEGAEIVSGGRYEDAVARAAADARDRDATLVSDTALFEEPAGGGDGVPQIPDLIVRGYTRLFSEAAAVWSAPPDVIVVQGGVGGLVGAAAGWLATMLPSARLVAAEPHGAACLMASARAGGPIRLPSTEPTSMVCLRCAQPNAASWPYVASGVDTFVTVSDGEADDAVAALAGAGIQSGAAGACGLAALTAIAPEIAGSRAMVIVTEGP